ncbi:MAG: efflux RND transporter periplasmic adaptor subunit [Cyclobacteriaceae bacterium]|nr:efflux RND transporter periplasmic adaptor subunit [Cyclobacteriaceae bacterium]
MKKIHIITCLISMLVYAGCESHKEGGEESIEFMVTSPLKKDTVTNREYVCQVHSIQHIELRAMEKGYLEKIFVDEGQQIRKGQLMFQIMPLVYRAEMQKAQAEAEFAEIEYRNTKVLADSSIVAPNELALAKAKLDKAKAELALAQVHLGFTEIRAPFDGIMDRFHVRLGSYVDEGELLTELSDNSHIWVYFNVPEAEYLEYKTRVKKDSTMKVSLLMANNKLFNHEGKVSAIEADFNNETGNIAFRATFPNPEALLRHGETGNILIRVPLKNAMLIPQKCTFEVLDKKFVFVVDKEGVVHSRRVDIEAEITHLYAVTGLEEGDQILLEGLRKTRDGAKIDFKFIKPSEAINQLELFTE